MVNETRSMAQLALAFSVAHPATTCAIPGARSPEQARVNAAASTLKLSEEDLAVLRSVVVSG